MTDSQMLVAGQLDTTGEQAMVTRLLNWTELEHIEALADQQSSAIQNHPDRASETGRCNCIYSGINTIETHNGFITLRQITKICSV